MIFIAVAVLALIFNLLIIPGVIAFSHRQKWFDHRDPRKIHTGDIPRTGGVGIFLSFLGSMAGVIALGSVIPGFSHKLTTIPVMPIAAGISILFVTGILDDFFNLRARYKLVLQILAAAVVVSYDYRFTMFALPFGFVVSVPILSYAVTLFWIVGVTNAVNLIDGVDGLAGGLSAIAALFWAVISLVWGHTFSAFIAFALLGAVLGFLFYNKPPAKIFMGDSGSLILGFLLAVLPLVEKEKGAGSRVLLLAITLLIVPIFDTFAAIIRRKRKGLSIGSPDKEHIHHKLLAHGCSTLQILIMLYPICTLYGTVAFVWAIYPQTFNLFFLPFTWIPALVFFLILHYRYRGMNSSS